MASLGDKISYENKTLLVYVYHDMYIILNLLIITIAGCLVHCYNDGIINGDIILEAYNMVQVYVNDRYVPICWEANTRNEIANTICKQLGLNGAKSTSSVR